MNTAPTVSFAFYGDTETVRPEFGSYDNGRTALWTVTPEGECWATITVNMPDQHLNDGEVFIKDWSENGPVVQAMIEAGWLVDSGREVVSGYVAPKAMRLAGDLLKYYDTMKAGA